MLLPGYNFGVTMDKVVDMCHQYLIGMAWVYSYYVKGTASINAEFVYRYHHTPLLSDLSSVLDQVKSVDGYSAQPDQIVLNPIHQLLSVLPLKSKQLLPKEVNHLMSKDSPISDLYPESALIERDGQNVDWKGIILVPFVDPMRVIDAVNTTTMFTPERARLYTQGSTIVLQKDPNQIEIDRKARGLKQMLDREKRKRGYQGGRGNKGRGRSRDYNNQGNKGRGYNSGNKGRGRSRDYKGQGYKKRDNRDRDRDTDNRSNYQGKRPATYTHPSPTHAKPSAGLPPAGEPSVIPGRTTFTGAGRSQQYTGPLSGALRTDRTDRGVSQPWKTRTTIL